MSYDDSFNVCDECSALGDDYYIDENDELRCACDGCVYNMTDYDEHAQN